MKTWAAAVGGGRERRTARMTYTGIKEGGFESLMETGLSVLRKESLKRIKNVHGGVSMGCRCR